MPFDAFSTVFDRLSARLSRAFGEFGAELEEATKELERELEAAGPVEPNTSRTVYY